MPPTFPTIARWLVLLALSVAFIGRASAQEQRVEITRNGVTTTLVLPEYKSQGVAYASLNDIMRQLGGTVAVDAAGASAELGGVRAAVGLNDVAVKGDRSPFSLVHPVLAYQNDALIAMSDVVRFLGEGYGLGTPDAPPTDSALALPMEDAPLESIEASPAPAPTVETDAGLDAVAPMTDSLEDAPLESVATPAPAPVPAPAAVPSGTVVLDPGHGGDDSGAVGASGLSEKEIALAVATSVARILREQYGVTATLTREGDEMRTVRERAAAIQQTGAGLVVSVHAGANPVVAASGPALFAHGGGRAGENASLAVAEALAATAATLTAPATPAVHEVPLALLRESRAPGVLVELGNLSNPEDEARLGDAGYREQLAGALAAGINRALGRPEPGGAAQ